jgi:hypothetical protein
MTRKNRLMPREERPEDQVNGSTSPARPQDHPPPESEPKKKAAAMARPLPAYKPFPVAELPRPLALFVAEGAAALGCDPAMVALPGIAVCGSLIGNTRTTRLKNSWEEPCIFWTCVIADSGTLKSPAHDAAVRSLHRLQKRLKAQHDARMAEYQTLHEQWKERKNRDPANAGPEPEKPILSRVVCGDTTVERLGELLEENPRGLLCARDELACWFGSFVRYKSRGAASDLPIWLEFHRAGTAIIDRKASGKPTQFIDHAAVSVCGTTQPRILAKTMRGDFLASGLIARLLLAMPTKTRKQWRDVDIDPATADDYEQLLESLSHLDFGANGSGERVPMSLDLDTEARQAWIDFYDSFAAEQDAAEGDFAAALSKLEGYAARFTLLHHVVERVAAGLDDRVPIGVDSVKAGINLARWFAGEAQRIYAIFGETEKQREPRPLVEWIMERGGETTVKELHDNKRSRYPTADGARATLDELHSSGFGEWISVASGPRGGRPSERFRLFTRETAPAKPPDDTRNHRGSVEKTHNEEVSRFRGSAGAQSKIGETYREPGEEG